MKELAISQYALYGWCSVDIYSLDAIILRRGFPIVIIGHIHRNLPVNLNNIPHL